MKKAVSMVMAAALVAVSVFAFSGCGQKNTNTTGGADATATAPAKKPKIVMGTNASFPPYEYVDDSGKIVGIDAEAAAAIADKMGYELEIKDMDFKALLTAVQSKTIDFAMAGMTVSEERLQSVNFSDTYAKGVQVIIVKEDSDIKDVDGLAGKKIGVQAGTTGWAYCTDEFGQENVKEYDNGSLAVAALLNGQVDCVVIDNEPAKNYVAANAGLKILDTAYADEDYAIAVAKDNDELLNKINAALKDLKESGELQKIVDKYIKAN